MVNDSVDKLAWLEQDPEANKWMLFPMPGSFRIGFSRYFNMEGSFLACFQYRKVKSRG